MVGPYVGEVLGEVIWHSMQNELFDVAVTNKEKQYYVIYLETVMDKISY